MQTFVVLGKYTPTGMTQVKEIPGRVRGWQQVVEAAGGVWHGYYYTVGPYQMVLIVEFDDAMTLSTLLMAQAMTGVLETEIMIAFTVTEVEEMIDKLP